MHPSQIECQQLTEAQLGLLADWINTNFPRKALDIQHVMDDMNDDIHNTENRFKVILGSLYDWVHYGN